MQNLSKPQKFMVYAYVLVFVAQFFDMGTTFYSYTTVGGGMTVYNPVNYATKGWDSKHWINGVIMAVIVYAFYTRSPKLGWYWAAAVLCLIYGLGSHFGGLLGLVSIIMAGYAVYLKRKEIKASVKTSKTLNEKMTE